MLPEPQKAAIMIKMNKIEDKKNNMNSVEEIEIGMKIMIIKDGEYQDSGLVIDILQNEIVLQDRAECFSYDFSEIDSFLQLRHA